MNVGMQRSLEQIAESGDEEKVFEGLQQYSLDDVGELLLTVDKTSPALQRILPAMASDEVQRNWTGNSGMALLKQSLAFVESISSQYEQITGMPLKGARILDYGCGWGRLIRLMYKLSSPRNIYGCDAWDVSLNLCKENNVRANLAICEEVPKSVPFENVTFDFIYSFSVFTHLSERTAKSVMSAMRKCISSEGLVAITVRPLEYWDAHDPSQSAVDVEGMKKAHQSLGFAFNPHKRAPIDGDIAYGDTSISIEYISKNWSDWKVVGEVRNAVDPYQVVVFLRPVAG